MKRVLVLGATGLVGSELVRQLLDEPWVSQVRVALRRPIGFEHAKVEEHVFDLASMDAHHEVFAVDQIFCAIGTTIKKAGSQQEFRRIDHDLPLSAAKLGIANGASHFLLVSALGASSRSRVFYNRVKGETEEDLRALKYRAVTIARPSLLLGRRNERRFGEDLAKPFGFLMPPKFKPIEAREVAAALISSARIDEPGVRVMESRQMRGA